MWIFGNITDSWEEKRMSADFGTVLRFTVFGESHGAAIGGILSGVPAGTEVDEEKIAFHMARRAPGRRGTTPRKEADKVQFLSGVLNGRAEALRLLL